MGDSETLSLDYREDTMYEKRKVLPKSYRMSYKDDTGTNSFDVHVNLSSFKQTDDEIKEAIEEQLSPYGSFFVKVNDSNYDERMAIITFTNLDDYTNFKNTILDRHRKISVYNRNLFFDFNSKCVKEVESKLSNSNHEEKNEQNSSSNYNISTFNSREEKSPESGNSYYNECRTLFIGNLDSEISREYLEHLFGKFGTVLDVIIKTPTHGFPYSFIKMRSLESAVEARNSIHDSFIGRNKVKVGFGKSTPSRVLWIGGLQTKNSESEILNEFSKFGNVIEIEMSKNSKYAYVLYLRDDDARRAFKYMRGAKFKESGVRVQVDFADISIEASSLKDAYVNKYKDTTVDKEYSKSKNTEKGYGSDKERERSTSKENKSKPKTFHEKREKKYSKHDSISSDESLNDNKRKKRRSVSRSNDREDFVVTVPETKKNKSENFERKPIEAPIISSAKTEIKIKPVKKIEHSEPMIVVAEKVKENPVKEILLPTTMSSNNQYKLEDFVGGLKISTINFSNNIKPLNVSMLPQSVRINEQDFLLNKMILKHPLAWLGCISSKSTLYPVQLRAIAGSSELISKLSLLPSNIITVSQKLDMNSVNLDDINKKVSKYPCAVLFGLQCNCIDPYGFNVDHPVILKSLNQFINYYQSKNQFAITNIKLLPDLEIFMFPPCYFVKEHLCVALPNELNTLVNQDSHNDYMVCLIISTTSDI